MPRPRRDGTESRPPEKRKLTGSTVEGLRPEARRYCVWDDYQPGLVLVVQPTGKRTWYVVYRHGRRPRWLRLGNADAVTLKAGRLAAAKIMGEAAGGADPAGERRKARDTKTFAELHKTYVDTYAKKRNRSWEQADRLVKRNLLPHWRSLPAADIRRADVKAVLARIVSPTTANQVLAAASAVFTWGTKEEIGGLTVNPCKGIEPHATRARERVLKPSELPGFWQAFDRAGQAGLALKVLLLCGQRPGEISNMRREHIADDWWELPGEPVPALGWSGTKNGASHRVYLCKTVRDLIGAGTTGKVFAVRRGALDAAMRAINEELGVTDRVRPHDLRRTFGTFVTKLKFGRDAMDRILNHRESDSVTDTYDRYGYQHEDKRIMQTVAGHITSLVDGTAGATVVPLSRRRSQ